MLKKERHRVNVLLGIIAIFILFIWLHQAQAKTYLMGSLGQQIENKIPKTKYKDTSKLAKLNWQANSKNQVIKVHNNIARFSPTDLSLEKKSWQKLGTLDTLGRPQSANAMLNISMMPKKAREDLYINPVGFRNKKIRHAGKDDYLYNRSHLIGFQLTGENNNMRNLVTLTRATNASIDSNHSMETYENKVASFLRLHRNAYVRYRVTPIYRGNELVPRGIQLEAKSIGTSELNFNVYVFNVQPGYKINYDDGTSSIDTGSIKNG
ncbi:hypothetical protein EQG49_00320 [Periweissella cryptocerci]|uniref:Type VII secretion system protein EssD-like domain-containing protein n=1 Tax=Periweissella cryptocerci TaxID=2506420 RepID=A0A4P6YQW1_9LACO|nr:DNA/RNA non-specific endonuclease [Periweissella cryptocerci]QBO34999.1 hypothetical protein EQG49_00320 [Periweissella cryptocerci]